MLRFGSRGELLAAWVVRGGAGMSASGSTEELRGGGLGLEQRLAKPVEPTAAALRAFPVPGSLCVHCCAESPVPAPVGVLAPFGRLALWAGFVTLWPG